MKNFKDMWKELRLFIPGRQQQQQPQNEEKSKVAICK